MLQQLAGRRVTGVFHQYAVARFEQCVGDQGQAAQHHGLGRLLVERACQIARDAGYTYINVISAIGTREYYRHLGFYDHGLYLQKEL